MYISILKQKLFRRSAEQTNHLLEQTGLKDVEVVFVHQGALWRIPEPTNIDVSLGFTK